MYYLSSDAKVRDNKFEKMDDAVKIAKYVAKKQNIPIAVYYLDSRINVSQKVCYVLPCGSLTDKVEKHGGKLVDEEGVLKIFDQALESINSQDKYRNKFYEVGIENALLYYLQQEVEYPDYFFDRMKKIYKDKLEEKCLERVIL